MLVAALSLIGVLYFGNLAAAAAPSNPSMSDSVTIPVTKDSGATLLFVPKAPSNLHATSTGAGFVTLHWTDNSNNEEGLIIERKSVGGNYYELESVSANTTTYEQSQLSNYPVFPGEHYYYRVKAFIGGKSSDYSNEFYIEVADNTAPVAPGNLKLTPLYSGALDRQKYRSGQRPGSNDRPGQFRGDAACRTAWPGHAAGPLHL